MADKVYNPISVPELSSSPSAPSSGYQKIYAKTNGKLYAKNSADVETELTNGPGGGISLSDVYPVGCIYTTVDPTNPATVFGFGTWISFAQGRTLIGVDTSQTEFDVIEKTGGAKTHTLTIDEMPSHTHLQNSHFHTAAVFATDANGSNFDRSAGGGAQGQATTNEATATNQNTGGGLSHNNLQPYITVYFWKRTA